MEAGKIKAEYHLCFQKLLKFQQLLKTQVRFRVNVCKNETRSGKP